MPSQAWSLARLVGLLGSLLLTAPVWAGDAATSDVSVAREVQRYLAQATPELATDGLRADWHNGLRIGSADRGFELQIGGWALVNAHWRTSDDFPAFATPPSGGPITADGTRLGPLRLHMRGKIYRDFLYAVQLDFTGGRVGARDVFVGMSGLGLLGTVRVGHQKEPFSLDDRTPCVFLGLMERASPTRAFSPGYNTGISFGNHVLGEAITWSAGVFRTTDGTGGVTQDGGYAGTVRVTGSPYFDAERHAFVHVGFGFSIRDADRADVLRFGSPPGTGTGARLVDISVAAADDAALYVFELAARWRSFSLQLEYFLADVSEETGGDPRFSGFYVELGWFVTGEVRTWSRRAAAWRRTSPKHNFRAGGHGWGAWQLVFRFAELDLNDGVFVGGEQTTITFGVNWHLSPHTRVMFNLVLADINNPGAAFGEGDLTIFQMRWQVDF